MVNSYDFVVVGGGMNGVNLAAHLLKEGVPANEIRMLDRHEGPISLWFEMTRQVGMEQVRSPLIHHLGGEEDSLDEFVHASHMIEPYDEADPHRRPRLQVFNEYLKSIIEKYRIEDIFQQSNVIGVIPKSGGGFSVLFGDTAGNTEKVEYAHANHLILAVGYHDNRYIPTWNDQVSDQDASKSDLERIRWIQELKDAGANVHHIYEADFDIDSTPKSGSTIVVGGGFSGVQLALKLSERSAEQVTLLIEYPIDVHYFDADPAWADLSSKEMTAFLTKDLADRRKTIYKERNQGSISPELEQKLNDAVDSGRIRLVLGDAKTAKYQNPDITLRIKMKDNSYSEISANRVLLATGYRLNIRPGGPWIDELEKDLNLPTHDGYPVLDDHTLQWGATHQLYVAGQLAELSLGPLARNIAGTQLSAHKIKNAPRIYNTIRRHNLQESKYNVSA